ncbi:hypothetical protein OEZ85_009117 [Tetradesmus obliquus]|uniref:Uncharacterized protein n=1 Tax=Tetradesmus obliquus TaxID=3088 RepID=A0ABY8TQI3_TETOB|nr:hypothetical protein OEZ85_009117 [Tetradesmus obliquus]
MLHASIAGPILGRRFTTATTLQCGATRAAGASRVDWGQEDEENEDKLPNNTCAGAQQQQTTHPAAYGHMSADLLRAACRELGIRSASTCTKRCLNHGLLDYV